MGQQMNQVLWLETDRGEHLSWLRYTTAGKKPRPCFALRKLRWWWRMGGGDLEEEGEWWCCLGRLRCRLTLTIRASSVCVGGILGEFICF
jgi:hypothetical protein